MEEPWADLLQDWEHTHEDRHSIAPNTSLVTLTSMGMTRMHWALVPAWSKNPRLGYATYNTRLESARNKPTYRHAWHAGQRCLIPSGGYCEWRADAASPPRNAKTPYLDRDAEDAPLVFAGAWDTWRDPSGAQSLVSCASLTRPATKPLETLHPRMPVILTRQLAERWIDSISTSHAQVLAETPFSNGLRIDRVSRAPKLQE